MSERIQKALATAGVASRREIEEMILAGRIEVNGKPATVGQPLEPADQVRVDGRPVRVSQTVEPIRVLLYKKRVGELVTREDPDGRRTIFRKLPKLDSGRWIAVGRLDINTSGLLLLTNNGELARRLTHPSFEIPRQYAVRVLGEMTDEVLKRLRTGVELEDGKAHFESIVPGVNEDGSGANQWWEVTLREGRNREVRRLFESQKLQVSRLIRVKYGPIELGRGIRSSDSREATPQELQALLDAVGMQPVDARKAAKKHAPRRDEDLRPSERALPFEAKKLARGTGRNRPWEPSSRGPGKPAAASKSRSGSARPSKAGGSVRSSRPGAGDDTRAARPAKPGAAGRPVKSAASRPPKPAASTRPAKAGRPAAAGKRSAPSRGGARKPGR